MIAISLASSQNSIAYQQKICKFMKLCYKQLIYKHIIFCTFKRSGHQQVQNLSLGPCMMFVELLAIFTKNMEKFFFQNPFLVSERK